MAILHLRMEAAFDGQGAYEARGLIFGCCASLHMMRRDYVSNQWSCHDTMIYVHVFWCNVV
ncbi:hypothetical protein BDR07DRAFT_1404433 [Suillus spraguei]|nr:hypothetical protein BDR07DRAFT_1404433 [Suillus spraguei]